MGKFNTGGEQFSRTIQDIIEDYARALLDKGIISDDDFYYYINDGQEELLDALFEKLYETEEYKGVEVSTLDAFYHYCVFVLKEYNGMEIWNTFVEELFLSVERNKDVCIMASRSLGKSFFNFVLYPTFKMFLYRGTKFLHVANIPTQCVENLRITKDIINENELLYQKKDTYKGKDLKWTERQIEYNKGMIITLSAGTSPRSLHVNYVIVDDMNTERAQLNDEEMRDYLMSQLYPTAQRLKGRVIVTGTPLHRKDLYHWLMNSKKNFEGDPIPDGGMSAMGWYSRMFPIMDQDGEPILPQIYDKDEIEKIRKKQGDIRFQREYMLNCVDENLTIFPEHLVSSISDGTLDYIYSPKDPNSQFVIGCDVATAGTASADFSAFVVMQKLRTDDGIKKVVRHIVHVKGMEVADQIDTIEKLSQIFNNALVVVEKNNVGVALIQELQKRNVNLEEYITTKPKKEGMIRYLVNEMKNKNLWLPEETNEITKLKKELQNFGVKTSRSGVERMEALTGHDDLVMALAFANEICQKSSGLPFAVQINR